MLTLEKSKLKTENKMKLIAKAILNVMQSVKGMEKRSKVGTGSGSYDGTKDQDVKEVFNKVLAENKLCILPIGIEEETQISRWEEDTNYGKKQKQSIFTKVRTRYMLLHESGESIELSGYGHGIDSQDKGAGKATTYALKNCLLYTFLTPVGKIDDTDLTHSKDIPTPQKKIPTPKRLTPAQVKSIPTSEVLESLLKVQATYSLSTDEKAMVQKRINELKAK